MYPRAPRSTLFPYTTLFRSPKERGGSRLLQLDRRTGEIAYGWVADVPNLLHPGDLLVVNNTRVFPARLLGRRDPSGGAVECLLDRKSTRLNSSHVAISYAVF